MSVAANLYGCNALSFRQHLLSRHHHHQRNSNKHPTMTTPKTSLSMTPSPHSSDVNILTNSTLIYFPLPGRGEAIRLALTISDIPFIDYRVPFRSWGATKSKTTWGTLPLLELSDGTTRLGQSRSILRFVGKYTGLYPSTTTTTSDNDNDDVHNFLRAQRIDELMDALEDLGTAVSGIGMGLNKDQMEAARLLDATKEDGVVYGMLDKIDGFIEGMGNNSYAVGGNSLTIADLLTFTSMGRLVGGVYFGIPSTVCDPFENIQKVRKMVGQDPRVMDWYDERERVGKLSPAEQVLSGCRDL